MISNYIISTDGAKIAYNFSEKVCHLYWFMVWDPIKKCGLIEVGFGLQICKYNKNIKKVVCGGTIFGNRFFKETVPEWINEYECLFLKKKNNVALKIFENLNHTELVSKVNIVSPWVLDFLLKV